MDLQAAKDLLEAEASLEVKDPRATLAQVSPSKDLLQMFLALIQLLDQQLATHTLSLTQAIYGYIQQVLL